MKIMKIDVLSDYEGLELFRLFQQLNYSVRPKKQDEKLTLMVNVMDETTIEEMISFIKLGVKIKDFIVYE